ncbi:hypothetical protein BUALT_Bualt04G0146800 [Buddleja alternifolia]|uniref:Uncharacterized protein n=1 Tax=Buddleja alternifolia TaxID=168488 RepID=A0AAV6XX08_9LAMI|nr:hypothetical protein BUALT_Bualt04G0146800 [Buddleja alternifolia]
MKCVHQKSIVFYLPQEYSEGDYGRLTMEMDRESNGYSTEDAESPRSVAAAEKSCKRRSYKVHGHDQIWRIKTEDSHLGEDIGERNLCLNLKDRFGEYDGIIKLQQKLKGQFGCSFGFRICTSQFKPVPDLDHENVCENLFTEEE